MAIFSRSVAFFPLHVCAPALCGRLQWPFFYGSRVPSCDGAFSVGMYEASYAPPFVTRGCAQNLVCYDASKTASKQLHSLTSVHYILFIPEKSTLKMAFFQTFFEFLWSQSLISTIFCGFRKRIKFLLLLFSTFLTQNMKNFSIYNKIRLKYSTIYDILRYLY